jgi:peptidoglycan/xylan/chitin deacetylase (PgdA/CDA1 family)
MDVLLDAGVGVAALGLMAGGYAYAANWPTSQIFGRTLIAGPDSADGTRSVALTYDDGPSPRNTPALLELLAEHNVQATFFLIGEHGDASQPSEEERCASAR